MVEPQAAHASDYVTAGRKHLRRRQPAPCKTVGSAYVGSNPTPATTGKYSSGTPWRPWLVSSLGSQMSPEAAGRRWSWDICGMARAGLAAIWPGCMRRGEGGIRWDLVV